MGRGQGKDLLEEEMMFGESASAMGPSESDARDEQAKSKMMSLYDKLFEVKRDPKTFKIDEERGRHLINSNVVFPVISGDHKDGIIAGDYISFHIGYDRFKGPSFIVNVIKIPRTDSRHVYTGDSVTDAVAAAKEQAREWGDESYFPFSSEDVENRITEFLEKVK